MLKDLNDIFLEIDVKDYYELFEKMNEIFLKKNFVKKNFLNSLIEREKKYPTGLNFEKYAVAIPHTNYDFVNSERIIFVRLKNEIDFIEMGTEDNLLKIKVVLILLIKDGKKQADILLKLMNLLASEQVYNILSKSNNKKQIFELLKF